MSRPLIFCIIGISGCGKSTFINETVAQYPDEFGAIQVGKEMRKRYPPEFFKNRGAMEETEDVVFQIFEEQYNNNKGKKIVLVDGQPRMPSQVDKLVSLFLTFRVMVLNTEHSVLQCRAESRSADKKEHAFHINRIMNDYQDLYSVLAAIACSPVTIPVIGFNTKQLMWREDAVDHMTTAGRLHERGFL